MTAWLKTRSKSIFSIVFLLIATAATSHYLTSWRINSSSQNAGISSKAEPLYWVAPMDPNYKRDKPGKSPMGMDLIPVYKNTRGDNEVGTVSISPDVVNNLGVRTAPVTRGRLAVAVNTVGYVQYDERRLVHIHPRVEGWIEKLYVTAVGDAVKQGEPLYALYSPTLVNAQEELLLALKRNSPVLAAAAMERLQALQVPTAEIDRLERTRKVSQTITITAPQSGVLDNLGAREGMFVKPGMEMMAIGQLAHIWLIGEVFERQAASVKEGDMVRIRLDYLPGREWIGAVDYIYPSLNSKTRTAQVRVHVDNPDNYLKPGMYARIAIATTPSPLNLLIPREALIRTGSHSRVVLAKGEGRFKSIEVQVGTIGEEQVEILSGLTEGEHIVTSAQFLIDSESSKTSDFRRMNGTEAHVTKIKELESAWVAARIDNIMPEHRMVTLTHEAIDIWQWPEMEMDFTVDQAVDLSRLSSGMNVHVELKREGKRNWISDVHIPNTKPNDAKPAGVMGHSNHDSTAARNKIEEGINHHHQPETEQ